MSDKEKRAAELLWIILISMITAIITVKTKGLMLP